MKKTFILTIHLYNVKRYLLNRYRYARQITKGANDCAQSSAWMPFFKRNTTKTENCQKTRAYIVVIWKFWIFQKDCNFMNVEFKFLRMKRKRKVHFFTKYGGLISVDSQFDLNHLHFPKGSNIGLIILVDSWSYTLFLFSSLTSKL